MPMQPSPWAETVRPPSVVVCIALLLLLLLPLRRPAVAPAAPRSRVHAPPVEPDLVVEHPQALLLLRQRLDDPVAMALQQVQPLGLAGARPDELGVVLHVADAHPGGAQPAQQHQ